MKIISNSLMIAFLVIISQSLYAQKSSPAKDELTALQKQEIAEKIKTKNREMWTLWEQNDPNLIMPFWSEKSESSWIGEPLMLIARTDNIYSSPTEVEELFKSAASERSSSQTTILKESVAVLSKTHCLSVMDSKFSIIDSEGNVSATGPWIVTSVWTNEEGAWKILMQHWSWSGSDETEN